MVAWRHRGDGSGRPAAVGTALTSDDKLLDRILRPVAFVVVVISGLTLVAIGTARATILDGDFYLAAADKSNSYERLYDEIAVDPAYERELSDLLARQPIPSTQVGSNLRLVLPPSTLRGIVAAQVDEAVAWMRGDRESLRLSINLDGVFDGVRGLALAYLSDLVQNTPSLQTTSTQELGGQLSAVLDDLRAGRRPTVLPTYPLDQRSADLITDLLVSQASVDISDEVRAKLEAQLVAGDLNGAVVTIGADVVAAADNAAVQDLETIVGTGRWDVTDYVREALGSGGVGTIERIRALVAPGIHIAALVAGVLLLTGIWMLTHTSRELNRRPVATVAAALGSGALLAAVVGLIAWWLAPDPSGPVRRADWPESVRSLVADNIGHAESRLVLVWFVYAGGLALFGALILGLGWLAVRVSDLVARRPPTTRPVPWQVVVPVAAGLVVVLGLTFGLTRSTNSSEQVQCNGSEELCDRRYDQTTMLATHNSMSSTQDGFLSPDQDTDMFSQLDAGTRGLLLDTWLWEKPEQTTARLDESGLSPRIVDTVRRLVAAANPVRPGLWLCHGLCRIGAIPMLPTLQKLRAWLSDHPHDVVTVVLQDQAPMQPTIDVFEQAGLLPMLATPPAPDEPWPTLGEMVDAGKQLVVFTQGAADAAPWLQNFYEYAEETPFDVGSVEALLDPENCRANRGGTGRRLFLLNHFVTSGGAVREAAAQANDADLILQRVRACRPLRGKMPTMIAIDFATLGDASRAVAVLNSEEVRED